MQHNCTTTQSSTTVTNGSGRVYNMSKRPRLSVEEVLEEVLLESDSEDDCRSDCPIAEGSDDDFDDIYEEYEDSESDFR